MTKYNIKPTENEALRQAIVSKIDNKTKPLGALGKLEEIALKAGLIQNTDNPLLVNPHIVVFAGDHGIANEGVSAYPQEVTAQMVLNFVNGGAAINVFSRQHGIALKVVDAGVNYEFDKEMDIIHSKVNFGTGNFRYGPALTRSELERCFSEGERIVETIRKTGCNIIGFGEMGIGNTSSASVIMSLLLEEPIEDCIGRGTGLNDEQYKHKVSVLSDAISRFAPKNNNPIDVLEYFGGFEIVMMTAAMLKAAELGMVLLVDGFIASSAFLGAYKLNSVILDYAFFCHLSQEKGHALMMKKLKAEPLLSLDLRLGEGTGCAIAYPVLQSSLLFLQEMASFESAGVSSKEESKAHDQKNNP